MHNEFESQVDVALALTTTYSEEGSRIFRYVVLNSYRDLRDKLKAVASIGVLLITSDHSKKHW